jgi:hypothetical protein
MSASLAGDFARATTIDGVIERMNAIDATLPREDGVAVFNRMYRQVTKLVDQAVDASAFQAGDFLARLDVHFGNLFFQAYVDDALGREVTPAWAPLFENRSKPDTHPIQFALAGMNAHISHDLPHAVVGTCQEAGVEPVDDSPEHHDFTETNDVLENASGEIRSWFHTGIVATLDDLGGRVDDALSMWGIHVARAGAWVVSQTLWGLQDNPGMLDLFNRGHRKAVELTSRGILI